jgi:hypothetical protein
MAVGGGVNNGLKGGVPFIFSRATCLFEVEQSRTNGRSPRVPERCSFNNLTDYLRCLVKRWYRYHG